MSDFDNRFGEETKTEWLTPPFILEALGEFDLDPCAPVNRPWDMAEHHFTVEDNGFIREWYGRVWMNPPYTKDTHKWMRKLAEYGNGTALIFARTETKSFFPYVWEMANGIFFFDKRLTFYHVSGEPGAKNSGAPSVLIAYGKRNAQILKQSGLSGKYIDLK